MQVTHLGIKLFFFSSNKNCISIQYDTKQTEKITTNIFVPFIKACMLKLITHQHPIVYGGQDILNKTCSSMYFNKYCLLQ